MRLELIDELRARVAELEAALAPFAAYPEMCNPTMPDGACLLVQAFLFNKDGFFRRPTLGDCRRAAALLAKGASP